MTTTYTKVCSNPSHDFYVAKFRSGWYAFATKPGNHPGNPDGRTMASFTAKKTAVLACQSWCNWMR